MKKSFKPNGNTFTVSEMIQLLKQLPNQNAKLKIYLNEGERQFIKTGRYNISCVDNCDLFDGTVVDLNINS